jgi:Secretion system C-terminal sorting domain
MKKNLLLILMLSSILLLEAQQNTFSNAYSPFSSQGDLNAYGIVETVDHGFMIAGNNTGGFSGGSASCHLTKVDAFGNFIWSKGFDFGAVQSYDLEFRYLIQSKDSSYLIVGKRDTSALCVKVNGIGDTLWSKVISHTNTNIEANYIQQTNDLGYIIVGKSSSTTISGNNGLYLAKLNATGNLLWSKVFGDTNEFTGYAVKQTPDSGFAIAGIRRQSNPYAVSSFILKTNKNGASLWSKSFLNTSDLPNDIEITNNGIVLVTMRNQKPLLIKTDFIGNTIWAKSYNVGPSYSVGAYQFRLRKTNDNGLIFTIGIGDPSYLIRTDAFGNTLWGKNIAKPVFDLIEAKDKGILTISNGFVGIEPPQKASAFSYGNNFGILKMDSLGNTPLCTSNYPFSDSSTSVTANNYVLNSTSIGSIKSIHPILNASTFALYPGCASVGGSVSKNKLNNKINIAPNPSNGNFQLSMETLELGQIDVYNTLGKKIIQKKVSSKLTEFDLSQYPKGIYYYTVKLGNQQSVNGKLIIN